MSTIEERLRRMREGKAPQDQTPVEHRSVAERLEAMRTQPTRQQEPKAVEIDAISGAAPHVNAFGMNTAPRLLEEGVLPRSGDDSAADLLTTGLWKSAREDAGGMGAVWGRPGNDAYRLNAAADAAQHRVDSLTGERRDILGFNPAPTEEQMSRVAEIDREREALRQRSGQLREDAQRAEYGQLRYRPDFAANSTRPQSALDDTRRRAGGEAVDERYLVGLEHAGGVGSMEWIQRAKQLTDQELAVYNYLRNTEGQGSADAYLDLMEETLNQRVGGKQAEAVSGIENPLLRTAATGLYAVGSGLDQFGTGVQQLFSEQALPTTATQFGAAQVREDLADASPSIGGKPLVLPGGASLGQAAFDLVSSAANMAPGLALSAATAGAGAAPWLSGLAASGSLGASAGGNAYNEAVKQGYTPAQARSYAILTGASEGGLQYLLGGIGALGGRVSRNVIQNTVKNIDNALLRAGAELGLNMLSEGAEEYLQEVLTPVFRNIALDENNPVELVSEEAIYAGILGALSAGVLDGPGQVADIVSSRRAGRTRSGPRRAAEPGQAADEFAARAEPERAAAGSAGPAGENGGAVLTSEDVNWILSQIEQASTDRGQNSTAASTGEAAAHRMTMEDFTNVDSPVWNNVAYEDTETQRQITQRVHQEMVDEGAVVTVPESTREQVGQSYPDLRDMKKAERTPILRQKMKELKGALRQFLNGLKGGTYEFEVNGNILEARLYDTGVREVLEKIDQSKASMLYHSDQVFQNARYLYSTPDYDGDPNIYRWNYFYTPVRIGDETVGVRIAVRDMAKTQESQIYNWGIKTGAALDGGGGGNAASHTNVSSAAPEGTTLDGGGRGQARISSGVSSVVPSTSSIPQTGGENNINAARDGGLTLPTAVSREPALLPTADTGPEPLPGLERVLPGGDSGVVRMSLDEYLGRQGLSAPISDYMDDKLRLPHGETQRQRARREADANAAADDYAARRQAAIQEYNQKVQAGEITPKSRIERLIETARGHDDNESVQAARRALEKRGIDWRVDEGGGPLYDKGPESSVGAARADFSLGPHERKTSRLADTALKNQFRGTDMTPEERAPYLETTRKTEKQSVGEAEQELYFNTPDGRAFLGDIDPEGLRDTMRKLKEASAWNGVQSDMAMSIKNELQRQVANFEITPEEYMDWIDIMTDHATATGQGSQAWAKYSRTIGSLKEEKMALDWLRESNLTSEAKYEAVQNMIGWENAVEAVPYGDTDGMIEQIDRLVRERGTRRSVLLGRDRGLSAVQRKLLAGKDFETLKEYARANAIATVTDLRPSDIGQKLRTIQVINHLLRLTTIDKNLTGNTIFGSLDASTNIVGSLIDKAVSVKTGTRSVAVDRAVFRGQVWRDAWDAFIDSALQVSMDINTNRLESRYGNVTNRTFKMSGGLPSRIGSSLEKLLGYALTSTDEFAKGFARSNTEYGLNKLAERGRIQGTDVEKFIRDSAEETAKYRTFQSDSVLSGALQTVSDYLNAAIGVGDSGRRTTKGGHKVHSFGLGSFLAPYTKVGGNLPTVAAHYSPAGVASGLKAVAEVMRSKNPSPAQQRAAVTKLSRGLSGTGAWAFAAWLFLSGICHFVSPDEDKDAAAQLESQGLSDIQLNWSALGRALSGQGFTGLQPGDQMQSLSSLEPMNAWLYAGAALASDLQDGGNVFSALLAGMDSTINGVMEAPVLSSFQNIYEDMRYNGGSLAGSVANTVADSISSSLLPGALKDVAAATDNRVRVIYDTEDPVERQVNIIKSGIPGLRQTLPVMEDAYGNEKRYSHNNVVGFLNKLLLPTALDTYEATEVTENLRRLYEETGDGSVYLSKNAPEEFSVDKQLTTLDQAGKDRYMDVRSAAANKALEELMSSSMYQNAGTQERVALVNAANSFAKDQGKAAVVEGFSSPATRAADAGIPFTSYYQYKTMLSEKPEGTTNANWNREVRNAIFSDTVLSAAQKKALDNILINDGRYTPEEKEVEYSDTESFLISQMSDSAQRRWPGIRDRFGITPEEYQEAVRIYNMDRDDGVTTADKKRMLRELFGQYGNAIYKALGEKIEDDEN